jgi:NAD-dependent deacetylase
VAETAALLTDARHAIALTGAGISTPSGIPDFRSPSSGLWEKVDPFEVASIWAFQANPRTFYDWIRPLAQQVVQARPNPAHYALARLEARGTLKSVITQNIDGLHQRAGSRLVIELHGHARESICLQCRKVVGTGNLIRDFLAEADLPRCSCGGVLKLQVVLYGEMLPENVLKDARREIGVCDLMLVAGSSLETTPSSMFPETAVRHGAKLIIVNLQPTPLDAIADVVIRQDVADILPRIEDSVADKP